VIHPIPITGETITKYQKLVQDPVTRERWSRTFDKEFDNLIEGDGLMNAVGAISIFTLSPDQIKMTRADRGVTHACIVDGFRPQKIDPSRVQITAGGKLIMYLGELTTSTANLTTTLKILWNSVLSPKLTKFMDINKNNTH